MKKLGFIMLVVATAFHTGSAEVLLKILVPPEHATVHSDHVYVIGLSSASEVTVLLNGVTVGTYPVTDSVFHASVQYGYGISTIAVTAVSPAGDSDTITRMAEILYDPGDNPQYQRLYAEYSFHEADTESPCRDCHQAIDEEITDGDTTVTCLQCHVLIKESFRRHTRTDARACIICHPKDNKLARAHSTDDNLCFSCHTDRRGMFSQSYIHGPVAGGSCSICHNPHGSPYNHALVSPIQILCFSCHRDTEEELAQVTVHKPFREGKCEKCHAPHATNNRWVLLKSSQTLCLNCHNEDTDLSRHSHPYNVKPRARLRTPLKLTPRGQLECLSCHNPHSGPAPRLLRVSQQDTCSACHEDKL